MPMLPLPLPLLLVLLAASLVASEATAPYGPWQQARQGGGGYWTGYRFAGGGVHYAWSDVAGLFRSDDGGASFRMVSDHGDGSLLSIRGAWSDPRDPDTVLVAAGWQWRATQGLYRSRDGGRSWRQVLPAQFYGNEDGRMAGEVLVEDPSDGALIAGSGGDGVWRSSDRGETWTDCGLRGIEVCDIDPDPHRAGRLLLHARAASHWRDGRRIALAGGAWESGDGGRSWTRLAGDGLVEVMPDRLVPGRWYGIRGYAELVRSLDGGRSWAPWHEGLPAGTGTEDCAKPGFTGALLVQAAAVLAMGGDGALWRRGHDEAAWRRVPTRSDLGDSHLADPWFPRFGRAACLLVADPTDPQRLVMGDWYALHASGDGGATWRIRIDGLENTVIHRVAADPADPARCLLGMADNGVFASRDGGASWTSWWHAAGNTKDLAIGDGGLAYGCVPFDHGWKANWLMVSADAGATWRRTAMRGLAGLDDERLNSLAVDPASARRVAVARSGVVAPGAGGVWLSEDAGESWRWHGEGLPVGAACFARDIWETGRELAWSAGGTLLASGRAGLFRRTRDGVFTVVSGAPEGVRDLVADRLSPGVFWLAAASGTWRSGDGGATWERRHSAAAERVACDERRAGRVAAALADEAGVALSDDGGASWRAAPAGLPNRTGLRPAFVGDRLVVGTAGNGVFWLPL